MRTKLKQLMLIAVAASPLDSKTAGKWAQRINLTHIEREQSRKYHEVMCALWALARGEYLLAGMHLAAADVSEQTLQDYERPDPSTLN